jgi:sugar phosphate isomerase/epimerase
VTAAADVQALRNADVVAVDLNDAPADVPKDQQKDNARELPLATGVIDAAGFLKALAAIGYDGPYARSRSTRPCGRCRRRRRWPPPRSR